MRDPADVREREPAAKLPLLRDRLATFRLVPRLLLLVWRTHRTYTLAMITLRLIRAAVPLATLWVAKVIIDEVIGISRYGRPSHQLWSLLALEIVVVLAGELFGRTSSLVEGVLTDLFATRMSIRIMQHAATLDLEQFEDPAFYDRLERARQGTSGPVALLGQVLGVGQGLLTLTSLVIAIATQAFWLIVLLALAVAPTFIGETHFAKIAYRLFSQRTPARRELDYLRYLGASAETAKEAQLFDLSPWLIARYQRLATRFYRENRALAIRRSFIATALALPGTAAYYGAYASILLRAIDGSITIGTLTFLAASFRQGRDLMQQLLVSLSSIYEQGLYLKDLFDFLDTSSSMVRQQGALQVPRRLKHGLEFQNVGFRYPRSSLWAVRHLTFALRPGERVALVGENGAGKTTLVKLIARLYDVSEGRILLDGIDVREYDLASLRRAIGVIFQDYVRYDLRFDENIGVGEISSVRDYLDTARPTGDAARDLPASIHAAAEKSLAASLLPRMPASYRQMLGRRFDQGIELSGGEWQKVALARAYLRDAQLLILDEPTAALDARAEYDVFLRFNQLMTGRMAILISHRFSTVRMADRIIVLKGGRIVEHGAHEELLNVGGLYAELFEMQAAGYR